MATQDMPPPGGFPTISVERTFAKPFMRQSFWLAIGIACTLYGPYAAREHKRKYRVLKVEQTEHYVAVQPFIVAEQERKFLRHLAVIREEEKELMANHPGWQTGTLYGEPIFKTMPKGSLPPIMPGDYIAHRPSSDWFTKYIMPDQNE